MCGRTPCVRRAACGGRRRPGRGAGGPACTHRAQRRRQEYAAPADRRRNARHRWPYLVRRAGRHEHAGGTPGAVGHRPDVPALQPFPDPAHHPVETLSYAECRQLEVAVALAAEPRVLLLDEPAAGMSAASTAQLLDLLRGLPADITLIFVEHDLDLVFGLATEVTVLHLGRVLMSGTPAAVQASADVQRAYLGTGRRGDLFSTERSTGGEHVASRA